VSESVRHRVRHNRSLFNTYYDANSSLINGDRQYTRREVVEMVLRHNGVWEQVLRRYEVL